MSRQRLVATRTWYTRRMTHTHTHTCTQIHLYFRSPYVRRPSALSPLFYFNCSSPPPPDLLRAGYTQMYRTSSFFSHAPIFFCNAYSIESEGSGLPSSWSVGVLESFDLQSYRTSLFPARYSTYSIGSVGSVRAPVVMLMRHGRLENFDRTLVLCAVIGWSQG